MSRLRFTVRQLMVAVAVIAALFVAPDLQLGQPEGKLVATVAGTAALAIEKARREVERARRRGDPVGPLRFPGRIIAGLPVAIMIIAACWMFNGLTFTARLGIASWLVDATRPGLDPHQVYLALMGATPRLTAAMDLTFVLAAFHLWDGHEAASSPRLPDAPVPPGPK